MQVKGGHATFAQLAEEWLLRSCKIFQNPYSSDAYTNALNEAEQFLWAGSELEPVSSHCCCTVPLIFSMRYAP